MAGGTWINQNKRRPGVYINVKGQGGNTQAVSDRGIVVILEQLSWGQEKTLIEVDRDTDFESVFGYNLSSLIHIREALKRAKTAIVYRVNASGQRASAVEDALTVTAKHTGTAGNSITVAIEDEIDTPDTFKVTTYFEGREKEVQTAKTIADLQPNDWVTFSGTGVLTPHQGIILSGGTDGTVEVKDYEDGLRAVKAQEWNTMALPLENKEVNAIIIASAVNYIKDLRENEGRKVQLVVHDYDADYEGVIAVKNGVVLSDGTTLPAYDAVSWVAGATAGAAINESLTYTSYDDSAGVDVAYTNTEIETALKEGKFVFVQSGGTAKIEQDINSLKTYTPEKPYSFSKNRVLRVLDGIANDIKQMFDRSFLGKVSNDKDGRNVLKAEMIAYFTRLENMNAITEFDSQSDVQVLAGDSIDSVKISCAVKPVDSIEKIYMDVLVQ